MKCQSNTVWADVQDMCLPTYRCHWISHLACSASHLQAPWLSTQQVIHVLAASFLFPDGLTDCVDPDCCQQSNCYASPLCQGSPDPLDLIQQSQPPFSQHPPRLFYDRIKFLIGKESTHVIRGDVSFDSR